jgi:hypothetical protein
MASSVGSGSPGGDLHPPCWMDSAHQKIEILRLLRATRVELKQRE